jgi:hypothetical protein
MTPPRRTLTVVLAVTLALASLGLGVGLAGHASVPKGIHKIQHVIVVMQENRSFDNYFGTYPGADGIPMTDVLPSVCVPDPRRARCVQPFHDPKLVDIGGPPHRSRCAPRHRSRPHDGVHPASDRRCPRTLPESRDTELHHRDGRWRATRCRRLARRS